jgi:hemolysin D
MNQRTNPPAEKPAPPPPATTVTQSAVSGRDREFLPAALEILETPPPPIPVAMMLTICAFFAAALVWSFYGKLDVHAVAQGKIERVGRAKVVQPLDPGKIAAIKVAIGDHVKAGDLVFELDPAEALADAGAQRDAANAALAEVARRQTETLVARDLQHDMVEGADAARAAIEAVAGDPLNRVAWDPAIPLSFRARESAVLSADLFQLTDSLLSLDKQKAQKSATMQRLQMSIAFQNNLLETLAERVSTRQESLDKAIGTKINLYDAKEELQKSQAALASDQGQLIETDAAVKELESEKVKTISAFIADNQNKLVEASRKADEAREGLAKAQARLNRTKIFAPIDGIVQQMSVTTIGQVVTTGQELAVFSPSDGALRVEALVANLDIGFIKVGQEVAIKVDAFPFTRFGVLRGKVERIAAEAVDEQMAKRALSDATTSGSPNGTTATAPGQAQSFVFPVTVSLDQTSIDIDGKATPLAPGMTVTAEIKTDSRRVIDYLISPLAKIASEALRER